MARDTESRYVRLFEDTPVALWEEDFSRVKQHLDQLRESGVTDFREYFNEHREDLRNCANLVQVTRVNKATLKLQGVEREEELLGRLGDTLVEEALDVFLGEVVALASGKTIYEDTVELITAPGESRHILLILSVPDEFRDTLTTVTVSMLDITESMEARKELENQRRAFQIIAEAALEPYYTMETSQRLLSGLVEILGLDFGTLRLYDEDKRILALHASVGLTSEVEERVAIDEPDYLAAHVARTKVPIFISDVDREPLSERPLSVIKSLGIKTLIFWPITGPNEKLLGVLNIASRKRRSLKEHHRTLFQIISDMLATIVIRYRAQDALRTSEERYRLVAENMQDVILIVHPDSRIGYVSPSAEQVFGYRPEELIGQSGLRLVPEEYQENARKVARELVQGLEKTGAEASRASALEVQLLRKNGTKMWAEISVGFLSDENGKPNAILGVARDVSERKMTAHKLEEALRTAAFYNDLMAHDLSNMQQGIMSSMELMLQSGKLPDELEHLVRAALSQSERGASLVRFVKKLAAVEGQRIDLSPVDPYTALSDAVDMVRNTFPEKRIEIRSTLTRNQYLVLADKFLVDVFYNLLHNSVRLDPASVVHIDFDVDCRKEGLLTVSIKDRGPGVEDSMKTAIVSGIGDRERRVGGLGMTLVRRIIDRYGGTIWVEDRVKGDHGKGACFLFSIPTTR